MSEIATPEPREERHDSCTSPVEKDALKERNGSTNSLFENGKNGLFKEAAVYTLSTAVKAVDKLFGQFIIVDKQNENEGVKAKGAGAHEKMALPAVAGQEEPVFRDVKAGKDEIVKLRPIASPQKIADVKNEINEYGRDPKSALLDALKNNRIVGLGEGVPTHNGLRTLVETAAPLLAASGVTHMAVDMHPKYQKILDRAIEGDRAAFKKLQGISGTNYDYDLRMMQALAKEGIKTVAAGRRDNDMISRIANIVESDPNAKVLCYVDSQRLAMSPDGIKSAGQELKDRGREKGYSVSTFAAYYDAEADGDGLYFAKNATRAVSVETERTKFLKDIPSEGEENLIESIVGDHDHAILFPAFSAVTMAELAYGPKSPKIVPALDDLAEQRECELQTMEGLGGEKERKQAEVEFLSQWAIDIEKQAYGANSPQVAKRYESKLQEAFVHRDFIRAEELLQANTLLSKNSYWHRELASSYEERQEPEQAQNHWLEALENGKSKEARCLAYFGLANNKLTEEHRKDKYFKEALSLLDQGCDLNERLTDSLVLSYANFLKEAEREEEAEAVFARIQDGKPVYSLNSGGINRAIE